MSNNEDTLEQSIKDELRKFQTSLESKIDDMEDRFVDRKQGFRLSVARNPITSCLAAGGAGIVLTSIAWAVVVL